MAVLVLAAGSAEGGVNGDGEPDVLFSTYLEPVDVEESCISDGARGFICFGFNDTDLTQGMDAGDVDGDGDVDVVLASDQGGQQRVCLNDGSGTSYACSDLDPAIRGAGYQVALGDVDSDGDLDAIFARTTFNQVCINDGSGAFTCSNMSSDRFSSFDVALGDVNNDGNLDAVFNNEFFGGGAFPGPHRVCLGDGSAGFTCRDIASERGGTLDRVALGDVDNDGNLDAVFSNDTRQRVCLGDGTGAFTCDDVDSLDRTARGVALGDIDNDGNLDAVFAASFPATSPNRVCLGNGTGAFLCGDFSVGSNDSSDVDLGDIDLDGNLDVAFAMEGPNPVCFGDGLGGFPDCTATGPGPDTTRVVIVPSAGPVALIESLIVDVGALDLPRGLANSLEKKLEGAAKKLQEANKNREIAAINKLEAFNNQVSAQAGKKIAQSDAAELIVSSNRIIDEIRR